MGPPPAPPGSTSVGSTANPMQKSSSNSNIYGVTSPPPKATTPSPTSSKLPSSAGGGLSSYSAPGSIISPAPTPGYNSIYSPGASKDNYGAKQPPPVTIYGNPSQAPTSSYSNNNYGNSASPQPSTIYGNSSYGGSTSPQPSTIYNYNTAPSQPNNNSAYGNNTSYNNPSSPNYGPNPSSYGNERGNNNNYRDPYGNLPLTNPNPTSTAPVYPTSSIAEKYLQNLQGSGGGLTASPVNNYASNNGPTNNYSPAQNRNNPAPAPPITSLANKKSLNEVGNRQSEVLSLANQDINFENFGKLVDRREVSEQQNALDDLMKREKEEQEKQELADKMKQELELLKALVGGGGGAPTSKPVAKPAATTQATQRGQLPQPPQPSSYNSPNYNSPNYNSPNYNSPAYNSPAQSQPNYYNNPTPQQPLQQPQPSYNSPGYSSSYNNQNTYNPPATTAPPVQPKKTFVPPPPAHDSDEDSDDEEDTDYYYERLKQEASMEDGSAPQKLITPSNRLSVMISRSTHVERRVLELEQAKSDAEFTLLTVENILDTALNGIEDRTISSIDEIRLYLISAINALKDGKA